jgi:hypothetical protein
MKHQKITTDQRRAFVMTMRDAGFSFDQIAAEAIKKFGKANLPKGYNKRLACLDLKRELEKHSPAKLKSALIRNQIFQYRMAGLSFQQILEKLRTDFGNDLPAGYSERQVCRDLKRYLKQIDTQNNDLILESRNLYRERLNFLLNTLWDKASQGDLQAIDRTLKILEAISKLDSITNITPSPTSLTETTFNSFANLSEHFLTCNPKGSSNENN